jgi:hypothetical protein
MRLLQRQDAVAPLGQMIKRSQREDCVHARVRAAESTRVTLGDARDRMVGLLGGCLPGLLHMEQNRVEKVDLVAFSREPRGVDSGPPTHIVDHLRGRRKMALEDLLRPCELELALPTGKTVHFLRLLVVLCHLGRKLDSSLGHDLTSRGPGLAAAGA